MQHGVLSGHEIEKQVKEERIRIDPFDLKHLNPASYDLTLGDEVRVYQGAVGNRYWGSPDGSGLVPYDPYGEKEYEVLDSRRPNLTETYQIGSPGWVLKPGIGYLMHTRERVWTSSFVPVLDGKSSLGRLFIKVHETAGYGDPGFDGQYTLEVTAVHPVRIYVGMRICQVRFHTIAGQPKLYEGNYRGETAQGAVASRSWNQFEKDQPVADKVH